MSNEAVTKEDGNALLVKQIGVARNAILATGRESGEIDCPICMTGKLLFSVAPSNGHVHAHCTTRLCVSWME